MVRSAVRRNTIPLFIILLLATGCQKDETVPREYPTLKISVRGISSEGVSFVAEIKDRGDHFIKEYGFVWEYDPSEPGRF